MVLDENAGEVLARTEEVALFRGFVYTKGRAPDFYGHPPEKCTLCNAHGYTLEAPSQDPDTFPVIRMVRDWHGVVIHAYRYDQPSMPKGFVFCSEDCPCPKG